MERRRGLLVRPPEAEQGLLHILRPESAWAYTFGRRTPDNGRGALSFNCGRRIVRRATGTQKGRGWCASSGFVATRTGNSCP